MPQIQNQQPGSSSSDMRREQVLVWIRKHVLARLRPARRGPVRLLLARRRPDHEPSSGARVCPTPSSTTPIFPASISWRRHLRQRPSCSTRIAGSGAIGRRYVDRSGNGTISWRESIMPPSQVWDRRQLEKRTEPLGHRPRQSAPTSPLAGPAIRANPCCTMKCLNQTRISVGITRTRVAMAKHPRLRSLRNDGFRS